MNDRIYKGYELLKAIEDGKIKYGTRFCMKYYEQSFLNCDVVYIETELQKCSITYKNREWTDKYFRSL